MVVLWHHADCFNLGTDEELQLVAKWRWPGCSKRDGDVERTSSSAFRLMHAACGGIHAGTVRGSSVEGRWLEEGALLPGGGGLCGCMILLSLQFSPTVMASLWDFAMCGGLLPS